MTLIKSISLEAVENDHTFRGRRVERAVLKSINTGLINQHQLFLSRTIDILRHNYAYMVDEFEKMIGNEQSHVHNQTNFLAGSSSTYMEHANPLNCSNLVLDVNNQ